MIHNFFLYVVNTNLNTLICSVQLFITGGWICILLDWENEGGIFWCKGGWHVNEIF